MKKISIVLVMILGLVFLLFPEVKSFTSYESERTEINRGLNLIDGQSAIGFADQWELDSVTVVNADTTNYLLSNKFVGDALNSSFTVPDSSSYIIYTGTPTATKTIEVNGNLTLDKAATVTYVIYKNGATTGIEKAFTLGGSGTISNAYFRKPISLATNDSLQVYIKSSAASTLVIANQLDVLVK